MSLSRPSLLPLSSLLLLSAACGAEEATYYDCESGRCDEIAEVTHMGTFAGVRESAPDRLVDINFNKLDFTTPGLMTFHAFFEPVSDDEGADVPEADLFQVNFEMTLDHYLQLFESPDAVELSNETFEAAHGFLIYDQAARAETDDSGNRHVTLEWDNESEEDTRRGRMNMVFDPAGELISADIEKQHRLCSLFVFCGYDVVFDESVQNLERTARGLTLRTDGFAFGQLTNTQDIAAALEDPNISTFHELLEEEGN